MWGFGKYDLAGIDLINSIISNNENIFAII